MAYLTQFSKPALLNLMTNKKAHKAFAMLLLICSHEVWVKVSLNFIRLLQVVFSSQEHLNRPAVNAVTTTRKLGSDFDWLIV